MPQSSFSRTFMSKKGSPRKLAWLSRSVQVAATLEPELDEVTQFATRSHCLANAQRLSNIHCFSKQLKNTVACCYETYKIWREGMLTVYINTYIYICIRYIYIYIWLW